MSDSGQVKTGGDREYWRAVAALRILMEELFPDGGAVGVRALADRLEPLLDHMATIPDEIPTLVPKAGPSSTLMELELEGKGAKISRILLPPATGKKDGPRPFPKNDEPGGPNLGMRYAYQNELGRGGQGTIISAFDRDVGRIVALKVLREDASKTMNLLERFLGEAQVTGQLEHPNIVPVHGMGRLPNGTVFYTMKRVEGRSLDQVLRGIRKADPEIASRYNRMKLLSILQQVCQGMEYAHARGVIHRDLKPANIMLGDFGEVLILDWGLAKVIGQGEGLAPEMEEERELELVELSEGAQLKTRDGYVQGTPPFMAPEQAKNERDRIGPWSDVYALGGILYQILTQKLHFHGKNPRDVMIRCVEEDPIPPRERAPQLRVDEELNDICMRALCRDPEERYRSARALSEEIAAFLEGTKRRESAQKRVVEGRKAMEVYHASRLEMDRLREEVHKALSDLRGWEQVEEKAPAWELEDRAEEAGREVAVAFLKTEGLFEQALAYDEHNEAARAGLAALYWTRFRDAEARRDMADQIYYEGLIRRYDDGRYVERLRGDGLMSVSSQPASAEVWIYRFVERNRIKKAAEPRLLGKTPVKDVPVSMGSYLLVLRRDGFRDTRFPVLMGRGETRRIRIQLLDEKAAPRNMVFVPAGSFVLGGDVNAPGSWPRSLKQVDDFLISRFPVSVGEYLQFVRSVGDAESEAAQAAVPRAHPGGPPAWPVGSDGHFSLPEGEGPGGRLDIRRTVGGVDVAAARAYAAWKTGRDEGVTYRLPNEVEWEKAARGADGRFFPWGDRFDPTFCKMRLSRSGPPRPEAIGTYTVDASPYDARDMAGTCREWTLTDAEDDTTAVIRGGSWLSPAEDCRAARRCPEAADYRNIDVGFRLVCDVDARSRR